MKNILGLDLGTNSVGWALVETDENNQPTKIKAIGSRIIPMSQDTLGKFDSGVTESQTAQRTQYRGVRRIRERSLQRRERLFRVLHILGMLPEHFNNAIGWNKQDNKTYGKFIDSNEPKIAWKKNADGKMEFVFMDSFQEMLADFTQSQPQLVADGRRIPLDWTLYYLRKKALSHAITKEELAWIILSFNQKRGYYQLRSENEENEEENPLKKEDYYTLKVVRVEETDEKKGDSTWYNIHLENGWIYRRASKISLADWEGKTKEFIVTTELNDDGSIKLDKEGKERRSFRAPKDDDWNLQKKRTEASIEISGKTVGEYIYDCLLSNPSEKVRGKLIRVVERNFYKEELLAILSKQREFIKELTDKELLENCIIELYAQNTAHQDILRKKDLTNLIVNDIIFYQRPLKSKKSLIADCPYESYSYVDEDTGEIKTQHIKCIAKSNPYFQEFRLWQFISNLRLFNRDDINEKEVTSEYLRNEDDYLRLYNFLNDRDKITQDTLMKDFFSLKKPKGKDSKYPLRWNYVEDKDYPCNTTRSLMLKALKKSNIDPTIIQNRAEEYRLWHLLYSINDKKELEHALQSYAKAKGLPDAFVETFKNVPSFKKEYGSYSEKAIKKLLSVMRMGSLWHQEDIPENVNKFIKGEVDDNIKSRTQKSGISLDSIDNCKGLPVWLACYAVYGRHSESSDIEKWETPDDLRRYINNFKQHSLRNPIVEQCILETLRTVHDIWTECGKIDEIHVELGRSMKSTAEQRKRDSERNLQNENTNLRIKQLLLELKNDTDIKDVRPYSPMQQEILRIYEEGALQELKPQDTDYAEISRISKLATPTTSELIKYKLWLEQKYCSPYTGKSISLSKLFTPAYQIEHIIPQGRYFDDSFSNKVICEAEVNARKSNMLGLEFIKRCGGETIHCASLGNVTVLTEEEYMKFVADHYSNNKAKARKLMMKDIPEDFIQRQMNDSRYISKVIIGLLSNTVREEGEAEATSKNVIPCTGGITDKLKTDWGLNNVWNTIVYPRFERLNKLTGTENFGRWVDKEGKRVFQTILPNGVKKKRIDHRHHAMDALVIALATRNIVNYLNNESAGDTQRREDLRQLLCDKNRIIRLPWPTFTKDALDALQNIVVSFKHQVRVINKATNYYEHYDDNGKKIRMPQHSREQWAARKPLHKETVFGHVNLKRYKEVTFNKALSDVSRVVDRDLRHAIQNMMKSGMDAKKVNATFKKFDYKYLGNDVKMVKIFYFTNETEPLVATRKLLDDSFDVKKIKSITDTGIQKILLSYLEAKSGDPKLAFSPEGIMEMNEHITDYNEGKFHQPIIRVRITEPMGEKYNIGISGNNSKKFVEAQSGTNLYFAIYENEEGKRSYQTIPLNVVVERLKQGLLPVPEQNDNLDKLKFYLSPNDLVYVPGEDEIITEVEELKKNNIYKFIDSSGTTANFIPSSSANIIYHLPKDLAEKNSHNGIIVQDEYGVGSPQSKNQKSLDGIMIKSCCWKLEVDRLGNITKIIR